MRNAGIDLIKLQMAATVPAGGATALSAPQNLGGDPYSKAILDGSAIAVIEPGALTALQLPNGAAITYSLVQSANLNLSSPTNTQVIGVQTGAGGVGAAPALFAARIALVSGAYWGLLITTSATANAAGMVVTLQLGLTN